MPGSPNKSNPWVVALASALRSWLDENGVNPRNKLANELGIPARNWTSIITPHGFTKPEFYAAIFQRTGLHEADPTTLPVIYGQTPRGRAVRQKPWTQKEYQDWLKKIQFQTARQEKPEGQYAAPQRSVPQPVARPPAPEVAPPPKAEAPKEPVVQHPGAPASIFDALLEDVAQKAAFKAAQISGSATTPDVDQIADQVVARLAAAFQVSDDRIEAAVARVLSKYVPATSPTEGRKANVETTLIRLEEILEGLRNGSRMDRDEFVANYGRLVGKVVPTLYTMIKPVEARERDLALPREV